MKSQVFKLAHALRKAGLKLSEALKRAWYAIKLKAQMMVKPVSFFYKKEDGSERFAVGFYGDAPTTKEDTKPGSLLVLKYYDRLAQGWRSCRIDRLILD